MRLNDDAIFIADSHTQKNRDALIYKLNNLKMIMPKIPSQIVLLGDIANLLVGGIKSSEKENEELIKCIKNIKSQIIYFEGNHDFNLSKIFDCDNITTISRASQPIIMQYKNKKILLAHGDIFLNKQYELYINTITSNKVITFLNYIDFISKNIIFDFIQKKIKAKIIKYPNNEDYIIQNRISKYKTYIKLLDTKIDMIIEGHFHIGKIINDKDFVYVAMPSFYHNAKIFDLKNIKFAII